MDLISVSWPDLESRAREIAARGGSGHVHTTVPGCALTGSPRRAIVLEDSDAGRAYAFFDDQPIEARAKPLAILLHGAESVPSDAEDLQPPSAEVQRMADRFAAGRGHFHILGPTCLANRQPGRWTILFEDEELGALESVTQERPLDDIRFVERLIYRGGA